MFPYHGRVTNIVLVIFFIALFGYAYFEARGILYGPRITIPEETLLVHDPLIVIRGRAEHISELRMNGNPISTTEDGAFEESHLLAAGYNRIVLEAVDRYQNKSIKILEVMYEPIKIAPSPETGE